MTQTKKRTAYSKRGCAQCKRSHYKCDEKQPRCSTCLKREQDCTYELNFVNKDSTNTKSKKSKSSSSIQGNAINFDSKATIKPLDFSTFGEEIPPFDVHDFIQLTTETYDINWAEIEELRTDHTLLEKDWRVTSWNDLKEMFTKMDPIFQNNGSIKESELNPLDNLKILDFGWSLMKESHCCYNLIMLPKETIDRIIKILERSRQKFKIIKYVLIYDSATLIKDFYKNAGLSNISEIWQKKVLEPSLMSCLNILKERLNISIDFCENVALLFSVLILFSATTCISGETWRTHLKGSYMLLLKTGKLIPKDSSRLTQLEEDSMILFEVLKDWFCHAEWSAQLSADQGGSTISVHNFDISQSICTVKNVNILRGYDSSLQEIFRELCAFLLEMRSNGVNLSGTNIVLYKFTNRNQKLSQNISAFGNRLYKLLNTTQKFSEEDSGYEETKDYLLWFSIKNCNKLYHLAIRLYLKTFFFDEADTTRKEASEILEFMLETAYAIPYISTAGILAHWPIYVAGLVSAVYEKEELFNEFQKIIGEWVSRGIYVAENSRERLIHINNTLKKRDYVNLICPLHDSIVY